MSCLGGGSVVTVLSPTGCRRNKKYMFWLESSAFLILDTFLKNLAGQVGSAESFFCVTDVASCVITLEHLIKFDVNFVDASPPLAFGRAQVWGLFCIEFWRCFLFGDASYLEMVVLTRSFLT